jgi:hypothetical protein
VPIYWLRVIFLQAEPCLAANEQRQAVFEKSLGPPLESARSNRQSESPVRRPRAAEAIVAVRCSGLILAGLAALIGGCHDDGASRQADAGSGGGVAQEAGVDAGAVGALGSEHRLASSGTHSCALRKAGLHCWGENFLGQLGDGTTTDSETPIAASMAGTDIVDVVVATGRTCVRRSTGQVACWGANEAGQIGDGTRTDALAAVDAQGVTDANHLAVSTQSTCAVRKDGSVACWGNSPAGSSGGSLQPVTIAGLTHTVELAGAGTEGYCTRSVEGAVRCFRFEDEAWTAPTEIVDLKGARSIAMSNTLVLCGAMPSAGILCHDIGHAKTFPLPDSADYGQLSGLNLVVCGLQASGKGRCWNVMPEIVLDVPTEEPLKEVAIAGLSVCVLAANDSVMCASAGNSLVPVLEPVTLPE